MTTCVVDLSTNISVLFATMGDHEGWNSELFVDPVDEEYMCGICSEVLEDAIETPCGHAYCYQCLKVWTASKPVCPMDQNACEFKDCHPMVRDRRKILGMKVRCEFKCETEMELGHYRQHRRECKNKPDDWEEPPVPPNEKDEDIKLWSAAPSLAPSLVASPSSSPLRSVEPPAEYELVLDDELSPARPASPGPSRPSVFGEPGLAPNNELKDAKVASQLQLEEDKEAVRRATELQRRNNALQQINMDVQLANQDLQNQQHTPSHARRASNKIIPAPQGEDQLQELALSPALAVDLAPADPGNYEPGYLGEQVSFHNSRDGPNRQGSASASSIQQSPSRQVSPLQNENEEMEGSPQRKRKRNIDRRQDLRTSRGCCGCNDKVWCCCCCFFWVLVGAFGVLVLLEGGLQPAIDFLKAVFS
eukprot:g67741.t1